MAKKFEKTHNHVVRDIKNILKRNTELSKHFVESSYMSTRGKCYPKYQIDDEGIEIIKNKYRFNIRSARFEYKYLNEIEDFLNIIDIDYIEQYQVGDCRIDLYIPKYNIAIEIDEEEHKYKQEYDKIRQKYIEKQIHCKFIRVNEGESCGSVIARIIKKMNLLCFECA